MRSAPGHSLQGIGMSGLSGFPARLWIATRARAEANINELMGTI